ncbi:kinase-like protein [Peniophora sp. CONT]|nr:kinase-like protein [Peniophora sp. CONT]
MADAKKPKQVGGEVGEVRANIDVDSLNAYLKRSVPAVRAPVDVKQFKFGQSNPTYFLTDSSGTRFVLRKKPAGALVSKTAHQVEREFTVLNAIHQHNVHPDTPADARVPVPEPLALCEDSSVVGTPFYIMEFLDGRIFTDTNMPEVNAKDRRECWLSAVAALTRLSSLDPVALGLSNFGSSSDYFPRQIKSLTTVSSAQAAVKDIETGQEVGKIPRWDDMVAWYKTHFPDERTLGRRIVHGDYKLDNMIFHPTENRVIGILDWELCTLGSPLADLGNMTMPWVVDWKEVGVPADQPMTTRAYKNATEADGVPIPLEDIEREYCRLMGLAYPIKDMIFVRSWMLMRLAIIAQGIAARYARRQASSEKAALYAASFPYLGYAAEKVLVSEGIQLPSQSKL